MRRILFIILWLSPLACSRSDKEGAASRTPNSSENPFKISPNELDENAELCATLSANVSADFQDALEPNSEWIKYTVSQEGSDPRSILCQLDTLHHEVDL